MSLHQNTEWLEAAKENFETALANKEYSLAKDIVEDIKDAGFKEEAKTLKKELLQSYQDRFIELYPIPPFPTIRPTLSPYFKTL